MTVATSDTTYLATLSESAGPNHSVQRVLQEGPYGRTRACFYDKIHDGDQCDTVETLLQWANDRSGQAICIVENISPQWMAPLGVAWSLDQQFFLDHGGHIEGEILWDSVMLQTFHDWARDSVGTHSYIEGILPHARKDATRQDNAGRRWQYSDRYGWQTHTRISNYRVAKALYLLLVDAPLAQDAPDTRWLAPSKLSLWVPYSLNRGGLPVPQLYGMRTFAPFEILQSFLSHGFSWRLFYGNTQKRSLRSAVPPLDLSQCLAASLWRTNIDRLNQELQVIAFKHLRRPTFEINNRLHDLREDLQTLRLEVRLARHYLHGGLPERGSQAPTGFGQEAAEMLAQVLEQVPQTERFLMDTFQLLMSSISVLDSQSSIQNSKRSVLLTQLATLYVPLSFVTGVWGMNIKEINDSPRPLWMFGVTLILALLVTGAGLLLLRYWENLVAVFQRRLSTRVPTRRGVDKVDRQGYEMPRRSQSKLA